MRGLLPPPPHPWLAGYTKEGSQSAPWSDSTTWRPEEEVSTVHCCLECEPMHSLHSAWAQPGLSLDSAWTQPGLAAPSSWGALSLL